MNRRWHEKKSIVILVSAYTFLTFFSAAPWHNGLLPLPSTKDNAVTQDEVLLGKKLFFDARLSGSGKRSCATCHLPERSFTEPLPVSKDVEGKPLSRNAQSLLNVAYSTLLLWDGRATSLEEQALMPLLDEREMASTVDRVLTVLEGDREYVKLFKAAFNAGPSKEYVAKAIASYERSLIAADSPFDEYLFSNKNNALSEIQKDGYKVFLKANCIACHEFFHPTVHPLGGREALFTDNRFHNLGIGYRNGLMEDLGRFKITQDPVDWGTFKTPTLRNVSETAPYMHDGSLATLEDVVHFYNQGGNPNPNLDPAIGPLGLTDKEMNDLVEFLRSLKSVY